MAVAAFRWLGNRSMAENQILERHKMVADAIILERAVRVLDVRDLDGEAVSVADFLTRRAIRLREKAESGD
jgi:hypothetical protein